MTISTIPYPGKLFAAPFVQSGPRRRGARGGGRATATQGNTATLPRHWQRTGEVLARYWRSTSE
eukprot:537897-Alexandrium_andersonii.AAC.1